MINLNRILNKMQADIYLECHSTFRNRLLYPNQADFVIPFGNNYVPENHSHAEDIILYGPIVYIWNGSYGYTGSTGSYDDLFRHYSEGVFNTGTTDAIQYLNQTKPVLTNIHTHKIVYPTLQYLIIETTPYTIARVIGVTVPYTYTDMFGNYFIVMGFGDQYTINGNLMFFLPYTSTEIVTQYANILPLTSYAPNVQSLLNNSPTLISYQDYYLGCGIADVNINQTRLILRYDPTSSSITDDTAFDGTSVGDDYVIYDPSSNTDRLIHLPTIDELGSPIVNIANAFTNFYIIDETLSDGKNIAARKIIAYDNTTQLATIETSFPSGWASTDIYTLRETLPNEVCVVWMVVSSSTNGEQSIYFGPSSDIDGYYVNQFFYKIPISATTDVLQISGTALNDFYYVSAYSGTYHTATIRPMGQSPQLVVGDVFNITSFRMDNVVPLLYSGSIVSQQEAINYDVSIVNIAVPNVNMSTGPRIVQYPYVFVSLSSVSSSNTGVNLFYANDPNSTRALFIITMTDTTIPLITPFLKTSSGSSSIIIKIKPNDALRFTMWLPDGSIYKTEQLDSLPPYQPNALLQIMCQFKLTRL